jgi:hypothetical protein
MDDDNFSYYGSLTGGRHLPLSGNQSGDLPAASFGRWDRNNGNLKGPRTFAATPPDLHAVCTSSRRSQHLKAPTSPPVDSYWIQNHSVMKKVECNTVCVQLPNIVPNIEQVCIKTHNLQHTHEQTGTMRRRLDR